jgi:type VI secretion system protein VasJ
MAAQAELDKLTSIHAGSPIDWNKVGEYCASVLRAEGKDLNAAVWLLCAWTVTSGVTGLAAGVKVLRDMLETYWDDLTPAPARLRARRNQIEWMLEWLDDRLAEAPQPVSAELVAALLEDWDALDTFWGSKDSEGPGFFRFRRRLADLPVEAVAPPVEAPAPQPAASIASAPVPAPAPTTSYVAPPASPAAVSVGNPDSDEAIEKTVNSVFSTLTPLIGFCLDHRPTLPLLFRLNRQQAWMTLEQAPPAQGSLTRLPSPAESLLEGFARLQSAGEPVDILRFCEGNLASYPFWLDLNRASHAALSRLGSSAAGAAATVASETLHLLQRLPTLVELSFSDGQPFADGVTRNWLEGLSPQAGSTAGADATQLLIDEAGRAAAQGQLKEALAQLQSSAEQAQSARNRFRLRGAQIELLHRFDSRAQLGFALDVLLREAREKGLDRWEPDLVLPLLELAVVHDDGGSRAAWAEQLAAMDLPTYLRLVSPTVNG